MATAPTQPQEEAGAEATGAEATGAEATGAEAAGAEATGAEAGTAPAQPQVMSPAQPAQAIISWLMILGS